MIISLNNKPYVLMPNQKLIFNSFKTNVVDEGVSINGEIYYTEGESNKKIIKKFCTYINSGETNTDKCVCWDATAYTTEG